MASKLNPNILYVQEPRDSMSPQESDRLAQVEPGDESSDSDGETDETEQKLIRKVSTSGQLRAKRTCPASFSGSTSFSRSSTHSVVPSGFVS
ncbi:hypothetical protein DPEC_G00098640 [Dallia pectoralis]|uniref:Uncharacterized protein n=1 Tax=Dallia pectoralis TaxID=75939 RepID=A0ACC2GWB9_DALPE|nr:hypothetical protein DPEC_G00098640 [Dallia pectoralis]